MYSAYNLTKESKSKLMAMFKPKFKKLVLHHITYKFPDRVLPPKVTDAKVVGYVIGNHIDCLIVKVNGTTIRPDGGTFHITLSLTPNMASPKDSNTAIKDPVEYTILDTPIKIAVEPSLNE